MKIRIHNDSLRVRLTQSEVARLAAGERVEQSTSFTPGSELHSSIESAAAVAMVEVTFDGQRIALRVPTAQVIAWANSSEVGIESDQAAVNGRSLHLLIEKDFKCLHGDASENADAFPNPREQ